MGNTFTLGDQRRLVDALAGDNTHGTTRTLHSRSANGLYTMTELCDRYTSVGRPATSGSSGSTRAAGRHSVTGVARRTSARIGSRRGGALICTARRQHPSWGPEKLLQWLAPRHRGVELPAISTAGDLLARQGLVKKRRRRRPCQHPGVVPATTAHPMTSGPRTSKGSSGRGMASTAIRSPSPISTRGS